MCRKVKIGDILKTSAGGTPLKSKKRYYENGNIPWLLSGEIAKKEIWNSRNFITDEGLQESSAKLFPANSVLVAMYGATAGQVGILRFPSASNQAVCAIYPNEKIIPEYLYYSMLSKKEELISQATGNAQPNISQLKIKNTFINLISLEEQKQIVKILDEAFAGIDQAIKHTEQNIQNAKELFESYLNNIFSFNGSNLDLIELEKIAYLAGRIGWKGLTAKEYTQSGPLFLSVHSLNYGDYVDFRDANHISKERYDESPEIMLKEHDILICKDGAGIGKLGIIKHLSAPTTINSSMLLIRAEADLKAKYLYYYLLSSNFQKLIREKIDGATTPHLYQRDIKKLLVPVISLSAQDSLIREIDSLSINTNKLLRIYKNKIVLLKELKQSLLQKAYAGELTSNKQEAA